MQINWATLFGVFLLGLGPIALGLFSIFGKEPLWKMTAASDLFMGKVSKRTKLWDIRVNISGVVFIIFGLYMLWKITFS